MAEDLKETNSNGSEKKYKLDVVKISIDKCWGEKQENRSSLFGYILEMCKCKTPLAQDHVQETKKYHEIYYQIIKKKI